MRVPADTREMSKKEAPERKKNSCRQVPPPSPKTTPLVLTHFFWQNKHHPWSHLSQSLDKGERTVIQIPHTLGSTVEVQAGDRHLDGRKTTKFSQIKLYKSSNVREISLKNAQIKLPQKMTFKNMGKDRGGA